MSEEQLHKQSGQPVLKEEEPAGNLRVSGRRRLLKSTLAIPVIMTLHSGAALARTSNLVGPTSDTTSAAKDANGDLLCVSPDSDGDISTIPVDLGTTPSATVRSQIAEADGTPNLDGQATECQANNGFLVSATAWNSIGPLIGSNITTL